MSSAVGADPVLVAAHVGRLSRTDAAVVVLAVFVLVAALYLARAFFVPLLIGILASYMLRPVVDWLKALHVPRPVAAALVLVVLVGSLSWIAFSLRDETITMIEKLPEAAHKLRQNLSAARAGSPTALQNMQIAANELQGAAADAGLKPGARAVAAREPEPTAWLRDYALAQSALVIAVVAQAPIVLLLTYFLLASGQHFRRKLVQFVGPSHHKEAVNILEEINVQIQRYLLVTLVSNTLIGVCTWLVFRALGMEQAGVWGFAAGVLHFMPYLGPALIALASGVAAFMQFGSSLNALAVAGASLLVAGMIGVVFMTWLQSHFAHMNAAVLFIALLFFGWMWGVWGLLLSAPLVTIAKVICDRVDSLKPVGDLLGR
ncbi:MAG: AI-2E family transporter [Sulfuricaulis sp.]|uniref:AI-2E family transporter n=1 Tax=Sulfuricaulis sp. TaxID=2003553 RepID=UPI003C4BB821